MHDFSVVILTKNEERNILRCIQPWLNVAEVLVVDNGSTDQTISIAKTAGARVITTEWLGYGPTKNFGNRHASHPWILSLDADEVANEELVREVCKHLHSKPEEKCVFSIRRILVYLGQEIKYGSCRKEYRVRLFHREQVQWNNSTVHEELLLPNNKKITILKGHVLHYSYTDIHDHWQRLQRYAALSVVERMTSGKAVPCWKRAFSPTFGFIKNYFFRLGFLDGKAGRIYAIQEYRYRRLKYQLLQSAMDQK